MNRWWWLGVVIGCHHEDKVASSKPDDSLLPCPAHSWKTPPALPKVAFGDACRGLDQAACTAKCEAGNAAACTEAGTRLGHEGTSYREQLRLYTHACELGDLLGCTNLGTTVRFDSPEWSPKKPNLACAADLFELTCAAGEPNGCGELGFAYADGEGRPRDLAKAIAAFKRGCVDVKLGDPVVAQSAGMVCGLFLDSVEGGKLGTVDPAMVKAAVARTCEVGRCRDAR
jgi:TPR repeat protein